jgi:hypothetical protein
MSRKFGSEASSKVPRPAHTFCHPPSQPEQELTRHMESRSTFPFVRALRGVPPLPTRSRPPGTAVGCVLWPLRLSTLGCVKIAPIWTGENPYLAPPKLIPLLIDLARLKQGEGLRDPYPRAELTTRKPLGSRCGWNPTMLDRRLKVYGCVGFSNKTGAHKPTFLNVKILIYKKK